jgi:hypothetical protein
MDTPMARPITPARIIALALIGLMVLGLAYLGHAPGEARVSVPAGQRPRPRLTCTYATEGATTPRPGRWSFLEPGEPGTRPSRCR